MSENRIPRRYILMLIGTCLIMLFGACYIFRNSICSNQIYDAALDITTDICHIKEGREKISKYYSRNKKLRAEWKSKRQKRIITADLERLDEYLQDQDEWIEEIQ